MRIFLIWFDIVELDCMEVDLLKPLIKFKMNSYIFQQISKSLKLMTDESN